MIRLHLFSSITLIALAFGLVGCETPQGPSSAGSGPGNGAFALFRRVRERDERVVYYRQDFDVWPNRITENKLIEENRIRHKYEEYPDYSRVREMGHYDDDGLWHPASRKLVGYHGYPYARRTRHPGFVRSPYQPYVLVNVRGIPRYARVLDPSCGRIFINPD
jgi:hypothetical protein